MEDFFSLSKSTEFFCDDCLLIGDKSCIIVEIGLICVVSSSGVSRLSSNTLVDSEGLSLLVSINLLISDKRSLRSYLIFSKIS